MFFMFQEVKLFLIVDPGSSLLLMCVCVESMVKQFLRIKTAPALWRVFIPDQHSHWTARPSANVPSS